MPQEWAEEFMAEAKQAVASRSTSLSHKVGTKLWYSGRKTIKTAPRQAVSKVGALSPIPGVGGMINKLIDKACEKVEKKRKRKKLEKYRRQVAGGDLTALNKLAKSEAKELKQVIEKIDTNQPKLKDAASKLNSSLNSFHVGLQTGEITREKVWNAALGIYERERYEDKLQILIETAREALDVIEKWIDDSNRQTLELEQNFLKDLDAVEDEILTAMQKPLSVSTGYGRL